MRGFSQIPSDQWVPLHLRPVAALAAPFPPWETRLNARFDDYEQDGLGPAKGAGFKTASGLPFHIEYLELAAQQHAICIQVQFGLDYSVALKEILAATGISQSELTWIDPSIRLT